MSNHFSIVFLLRKLDAGGAERQFVALARGLAASGHDVSAICLYSGGSMEDELADSGVVLYSLGKQGRWHIIGPIGRLVKLLRRIRPDVIHGYLPLANVLALIGKIAVPGIKVIWGIRNSVDDAELKRFDLMRRLSFMLEVLLSPVVDLAISNSQSGHDAAIRRGLKGTSISVIPNGIDTSRFTLNRELGQSLRTLCNVPDDAYLIGLVGRLDPLKDHETFLKGAALLLKHRKDVRFVCIGDGEEAQKIRLQNMAKNLGLSEALTWAGGQSDMPAVYNALDLLCLTSTSEGFPNVLAEAMSSGIRCVATNVGDAKLIIEANGNLISPGDTDALFQACNSILEQISNDPEGAQRARASIIDRFSVDKLVHQSERAIRQVVSGGQAHFAQDESGD